MVYGLYGLGNPLMDYLVGVTNDEFRRFSLKKGTVTIVSREDLMRIKGELLAKDPVLAPGGATSNAVTMFTLLGGRGFFCGKVGSDETGFEYERSMNKMGVQTKLARGPGLTGTAITLITPDSERTFAVYLGEAVNMKKEDVDLDSLKKAKALYIGGHEMEDEKLREVSLYAMEFAKKHKVKIILDLADPGIIERQQKLFQGIIKKYAYIVFANEAEAMALTGMMSAEDAVDELAKMCSIAIVKLGSRGSMIKKGKKKYVIKGVKVNAVDTTGAGDAFSGAFLYSFLTGNTLEVSGNLGSYVAAIVVSRIGARLDTVPDISHIIR